MRLVSIIGTRPEAIKMAPVALAAGRRGMDHLLVCTGQHGRLADTALADFGLAADARLSLPPTGGLDALNAALLHAIRDHLATRQPDLVLVQGDTASALAGARAAASLGLPLGHVEAGLRSFDLANPYPEEGNRIAIDALSDLLFAPTDQAAAHLRADSQVTGRIAVTGNTGIDALLIMRGRIAPAPPGGPHRILATCHRRESFGAGIAGICEGLAAIAARGDVDIMMPVHPNPEVAGPVRARLSGVPGIRLVDPLPYRPMVEAMVTARLILTDSGGVQEEAATLGIPTLVLRDVTERPEGVASGTLRLVGTDPERIAAAAFRLLDDGAARAAMARPSLAFGDGNAADRILDMCQTIGRR